MGQAVLMNSVKRSGDFHSTCVPIAVAHRDFVFAQVVGSPSNAHRVVETLPLLAVRHCVRRVGATGNRNHDVAHVRVGRDLANLNALQQRTNSTCQCLRDAL